MQVAGQAAAGLMTGTGEVAAARWLDAEDATMGHVLAWALAHDPAAALRLATALGWWWFLRGRLGGQYLLLGQAAGGAEPGSDEWCAAQDWLGRASLFSADMPRALGHFTAARDAMQGRGPSRLLADVLAARSVILLNLGRTGEGAEEGRRALAMARELRYPAGEAAALVLAAIQGGRQRAGCVFAGERGFRGGSGCGGVACDDTVSVSVMGGPPRYLFAEVRGEGRESARRHHCSR